jgi:hypothetical protein
MKLLAGFIRWLAHQKSIKQTFQSGVGRMINANINGALNTLRKSITYDFLIKEQTGRGLVF